MEYKKTSVDSVPANSGDKSEKALIRFGPTYAHISASSSEFEFNLKAEIN